MADISTLLEDVQNMISVDVPDEAVTDAVRWSARDFLRRSRWLRETLVTDISTGINAYPLTATITDTEVFGLQAAQITGLDYLTPSRQESVVPESGGYYFFSPPNIIQLSETPAADITDGLRVRALLNITIASTTIPDSVLAQWNAYISYGAIMRLCSMKRSEWQDQDLADRYEGKYEVGLQMATYEAERQSTAYAYGVA